MQQLFHSGLLRINDYSQLARYPAKSWGISLILGRRGRRPSWLNQGIFRKIDQDNCFIIQQILFDYHFQNEKNCDSTIKTPLAFISLRSNT